MRPNEFSAIASEEFRNLEEVLAPSRLDVAVPSCPGWTLRDLAWHLSQTYEWMSAALLGTSEPSGPGRALPRDAELLDDVRETSSRLFSKLQGVDPDSPCWTMASPNRAGFWIRRAAQETAVHRWDAQNAIGTPDPILPALAADGVAEVEEMFFPRQIRLGREQPLQYSLELHFTDVPATPVVFGSVTTVEEPRSGVVVSGPAEALLLLLWKRIGSDDPRLDVAGAPEARRAVLGAALTP